MRGFVLLINVVLALLSFVSGMSALYIGIFWLVDFLTAAQAWASTGKWPPITLYHCLEKYSVPIPHTDMIGIQNFIDGWLAQSGLLWIFLVIMGCAGISNWLSDQIIPMTKKTMQEPAGPRRYTDEELRRALDRTIAEHRSKQRR